MKLFSVNFELFKVLNEISVISQIKGERFIKTYPKCEIGPVRLKQRGSPVRFSIDLSYYRALFYHIFHVSFLMDCSKMYHSHL